MVSIWRVEQEERIWVVLIIFLMKNILNKHKKINAGKNDAIDSLCECDNM